MKIMTVYCLPYMNNMYLMKFCCNFSYHDVYITENNKTKPPPGYRSVSFQASVPGTAIARDVVFYGCPTHSLLQPSSLIELI